jgi:formamidopyrimidine-DNA glycosylase
MPELPDLVHIASVLGRTVVGRPIVDVEMGDPVVLRLLLPAPLPELLVGRCIRQVERRGHFLRFALDGELVLVVNLMLTGRFALSTGGKARRAASTILALHFADGPELRYTDEKRMGKIYVARTAQEGDIPGYRDLGVDLLSEAFSLARFRELCAGRRDQVRQFLLDKTALASVGNAYADEILFAARLHPKTFCHRLGPDEVDGLYGAIRRVLGQAIAEIAARGEPIDVEVRDFLAVRGRARQPCRVCGTVLRAVRVGAGDACFCPTCQPTERRLFVDFRKLAPLPGDLPASTSAAGATIPGPTSRRRRWRRGHKGQ